MRLHQIPDHSVKSQAIFEFTTAEPEEGMPKEVRMLLYSRIDTAV